TSAPVGNLITYQSSLSDSNGDVSRPRDTGGSDAIVARHRVRGGLRVGAAAATQRPDLAQCGLVLRVRQLNHRLRFLPARPRVNRPTDPGYYSIAIGPIAKNVWYDFVYHVKWSSGSDGLFQAWLNGRQVMNYSGPNLYVGQSCYLKLANYHTPLGVPISVIHSRVVRGTTQADVQIGSGATPPPTVPVPTVVGQTQATATSASTGAGLTRGAVAHQSSSMVASGSVISESPAAGADVVRGPAVNLVVPTGGGI